MTLMKLEYLFYGVMRVWGYGGMGVWGYGGFARLKFFENNYHII